MNEATHNPETLYREALARVKDELGVPGEGYPAPVANAWYIADAALNGHRFALADNWPRAVDAFGESHTTPANRTTLANMSLDK